MPRYRQEEAINGRWSRVIYPVMKVDQPYRMACCDCGLVHDIEFWIDEERVAMRVARNNRATGQIRRRHHRERLNNGKS